MSRYYYSIPPQKKELLSEFEADLKTGFKAQSFTSAKLTDTDTVVVCGGDGGLNYAINRLIDKDFKVKPSLIYIPSGTGNDFARAATSYNGESASEWFEYCNKGTEVNFPLVRCNSRVFINVASGLNAAEITGQASKGTKDFMGALAYYLNGLSKLRDLKLYKSQVEAQDIHLKSSRDLLGFIVASGVYAGGGIKVKSEDKISDQGFEVLLIGENSSVQLLDLLVRLQGDRVDLEGLAAWNFKAQKAQLRFAEKVRVNLDGEAYEDTVFDFEIVPEAVRFKLPYADSDTV